MFSTNQRMSLYLTLYMYLLSVNGGELHSANNNKNELNDYPRKRNNMTREYVQMPDNNTTLDGKLTMDNHNLSSFITPNSTKMTDPTNTIDYISMSSFTNRPYYNKTLFVTNSSGNNINSYTANTTGNNSMSSLATNQHNGKMPSSVNRSDTISTPYSYNMSDGISTSHPSYSTPYSTNTPGYDNRPYPNNTAFNDSTTYATTTPNFQSNTKPYYFNSERDNSTSPSTYALDIFNSTSFSTITPDYNSTSLYDEYDYYNAGKSFQDYFQDSLLTRAGKLKPFAFQALRLCPQMKFCSLLFDPLDIDGDDEVRDTTPNLNTLSSQCCTYCSCLPSCVEMNNCCPDASVNRQSTVSETMCYNTYMSYTSVLKVSNKPKSKTITYRTFVNCNEIARLDPRPASFDDAVRVSTDDRLYLSKNCALQHGETRFKRWKLIATECTSDLYSLHLQGSELEAYVLRNCLVYSMPPPNLDVDSFICHSYDEMINYCNETGLRDRFNYHIDTICALSQESYVYDEGGVVYRNIFCLMCNKPTDYKAPLTCPDRRQTDEPLLKVSYDLLLNKKSNDNYLNNNSGCNPDQVFDALQGNCKNLLCPFQRRPYRGECIPRLFEARNRVFPVLIKIQLLESVTLNVIKPSAKSIFFKLLRYLNVLNVDIQKNFLSTFTSHFTNYVDFLVLTLHLQSSKTVSEEWLTNILRNLKLNDSHIDTGNVNTPVKISAVIQHEKNGEWHSDDTDIFYKQETLIIRTKDCPECYVLSIGKMVCPHIRLNKTEYCQIENKLYGSSLSVCLSASTKGDGNFTVEQVIENGYAVEILYVCWADYKTWTGRWRNETAEISASTRYQSLSLSAVLLLATFMLCI